MLSSRMNSPPNVHKLKPQAARHVRGALGVEPDQGPTDESVCRPIGMLFFHEIQTAFCGKNEILIKKYKQRIHQKEYAA